MMDSEVNQIERIVREVMRRLQQGSAAGATSSSDEVCDTVDVATLNIDQRVVTGDLLSGRLKGVRRVKVRDDAIVTPLVKDLLKEKNVQLQRVLSRSGGVVRRWLMVERGHGPAEALLTQLQTIDAQWTSTDDWQLLVDSVAKGDVAVVVTPAWATRVCQANRRRTVHAVHVVDAATVHQAIAQVQANMLVVNAEQVDETAIVEIAREYVRSARK